MSISKTVEIYHIKFLICFTQGWEFLSFDVTAVRQETRGSFVYFIFNSKLKIENRFIIVLPFPPVIKNGEINTQLLFSTVNIKKIIEPWIF